MTAEPHVLGGDLAIDGATVWIPSTQEGDLQAYLASLERILALDDPSPNRIGFDLARVMRTEYRIDDFQQNYFVIPSFDELLRATVETDFAPLYEEILAQPDIPIAAIEPGDRVLTKGTQSHVKG